MTEENNGKLLWQAVKIINRAGHEIDALLNLTTQKICEAELVNVNNAELDESATYSNNSDSEWVCIDETRYIDLTPTKSQSPKGVLGLEIVIGDLEDIKSLTGTIPVLNILFYSDSKGYLVFEEEDTIIMYTSATEWEGYDITGDNCLIYSNESSGIKRWNNNEKEWYFSIPLTSLNRPEDIDRLIIEPIKTIFENFGSFNEDNESIKECFKKRSEIIRYQKDKRYGFKPVKNVK